MLAIQEVSLSSPLLPVMVYRWNIATSLCFP
jgi:hypothetical protein